MTFQWALLLATLAVVPLLIAAYAWSLRRRQPVATRYSSLVLIREAMPGRLRLRRHLPFVLFAASVAALALALARPSVVLSVPSTGTTVILAMDVSGSMCSTDIAPTRLEVAQDAAVRFVEGQPGTTRIGIVAFSGFATVIQRPTTDHSELTEALRSLTTGRRTAVGSGILMSIDAIAEVDRSVHRSTIGRPGVEPPPVVIGAYAPAIIVVLTDGASNSGEDPLDAAHHAAARGLRVYTIGYGTAFGGEMSAACRPRFLGREPGSGPDAFGGGGGGGPGDRRRAIDEDTLEEIASVTGGTYFPAESASQLSQVFGDLPTSLITDHEVVEVSVLFVALGVALGGAALMLGRAWRPLP